MRTIKGKAGYAILTIAALVLAGCGNSQEEQFEEERLVYEDRINEVIAAVDNEINEIHAELADATEEEIEKMYERLVALEETRSELTAYLHELRDAVYDEWEDVRSEIDQVMEEAENTLQELMAKL